MAESGSLEELEQMYLDLSDSKNGATRNLAGRN